MEEKDIVFETCLVIVRHFKNLLENNGNGFHSRIFSHMLHPEKEYIFIGSSHEVKNGENIHPEHVVPCAVLISECCRLIRQEKSDLYIASLLKKHWKIAHISKAQANLLYSKLGLKSVMPEGWSFENGSTLARLEKAEIEIV